MTKDEAATWLRNTRRVCRDSRNIVPLYWLDVILDVAWDGGPAELVAMSKVVRLRAIAWLRIGASKPVGWSRDEWTTAARVLGFCAAVLRATVEERPEDALVQDIAVQQSAVAADAIAMAKLAEEENARLRAALVVVEILAKDWDELAEHLSGASWDYREGLRYCAKKLRKALPGEGGRS
jgi:hypothetical protein